MAVKVSKKDFPDFFYSNEPLPSTVTPLSLKNGTYYMLSVNEKTTTNDTNFQYYLPPYEDNDDGMIDCLDVEDTYEIVPTKSGKFMTSFYVPSQLQAVIIGAKGRTLRTLEERTSTRIKVPRINEKGDVKITGNSERSVASARNQISLIVLNKREKMPATHFLSIPILSEEIQGNFQKFKDEILNDKPTRGINSLIFQNPKRLHLTLTMLTLLDDTEIEKAKQVLLTCQQDVINKLFPKGEKHEITVKGIEIMNDDPSEAYVLYGKVQMDDTRKLQLLADEIVNYFLKKGLMKKKEYDNVKLHVTVMNSSFKAKENNSPKESFDATDIMKKYQEFYFGRTAFETVELSIRHTTSSVGYYESACTVFMLENVK